MHDSLRIRLFDVSAWMFWREGAPPKHGGALGRNVNGVSGVDRQPVLVAP